MKSTQSNDSFPFPTKRISLGLILTLSFAALTVIAVGLTGYLSFNNGRQAVNEVAGQLRREITTQIERQLESFLKTSLLINQINGNAAQQGLLEVDDPAALERYFWQQMQTFDTATSIYFGNIHGGLADAGREAHNDQLYVIATDGFQAGSFRKYATDDRGNRAELLQTVPNFDARTRPWYTRAVDSGQPAWSDIYILFTGQDMALAASQPIYDAAGRLLGVMANDIFLYDLSDFLKSLAIGRHGEDFIVEHCGLLVD
ncbi:MAG: PDC sensor domain-containing protein [Anaerolineae bacterium]|nr:PDC sensor domain-containing protein [Anaerolineae bacterium]